MDAYLRLLYDECRVEPGNEEELKNEILKRINFWKARYYNPQNYPVAPSKGFRVERGNIKGWQYAHMYVTKIQTV
jgi:hypothetical protein